MHAVTLRILPLRSSLIGARGRRGWKITRFPAGPGRILGLTIVITNPSVCLSHAFIVTSPLDGFSSYLA